LCKSRGLVGLRGGSDFPKSFVPFITIVDPITKLNLK
jgi:hypothetical protein